VLIPFAPGGVPDIISRIVTPVRAAASPAQQALLSGEVKAGKLRALGLAMARRSPALPDLKTIGEQGVAGVEADTWAGLYAPPGTSAAIVNRLNAELLKALEDSGNARKISELGVPDRTVLARRARGAHRDRVEEMDRDGEGRQRRAGLTITPPGPALRRLGSAGHA